MLTGGRSPGILVFRIVVRGRPFLLRIIMRTDDATRHFSCMRTAAEAGIAPHVWYSSAEDRISITDFVEARPFPLANALVRMPATLRSLHELAPFPGAPDHLNTSCMFLMNGGPALDGFVQSFRATNTLPHSQGDELVESLEQLTAVYPRRDPEMVSSHNDLFKPDNVLFDGNRVWLVDWEAAFLNDRYADLAVVGNLIIKNEAEERVFFSTILDNRPTSTNAPGSFSRNRLRTCSTQWYFCYWVCRVSRRMRLSSRLNSETFLGGSGRAKSSWLTNGQRLSTDGFIGNNSPKRCGEHDSGTH